MGWQDGSVDKGACPASLNDGQSLVPEPTVEGKNWIPKVVL